MHKLYAKVATFIKKMLEKTLWLFFCNNLAGFQLIWGRIESVCHLLTFWLNVCILYIHLRILYFKKDTALEMNYFIKMRSLTLRFHFSPELKKRREGRKNTELLIFKIFSVKNRCNRPITRMCFMTWFMCPLNPIFFFFDTEEAFESSY